MTGGETHKEAQDAAEKTSGSKHGARILKKQRESAGVR
jgi:hypothetical protein